MGTDWENSGGLVLLVFAFLALVVAGTALFYGAYLARERWRRHQLARHALGQPEELHGEIHGRIL